MQLLVIRHAIAEEREVFAETGEDDSRRPLTKRGERKMRAGVDGLRRLLPTLDVVAASPLVRAQQTADIVAKAYDDIPVHTTNALSPDSELPSAVRWLRQQDAAKVVAIVGHEPHLGALVTYLMAGLEDSRVSFRKGGACLLEFSVRPAAGKATLLWSLTPSQLRSIGR